MEMIVPSVHAEIHKLPKKKGTQLPRLRINICLVHKIDGTKTPLEAIVNLKLRDYKNDKIKLDELL